MTSGFKLLINILDIFIVFNFFNIKKKNIVQKIIPFNIDAIFND